MPRALIIFVPNPATFAASSRHPDPKLRLTEQDLARGGYRYDWVSAPLAAKREGFYRGGDTSHGEPIYFTEAEKGTGAMAQSPALAKSVIGKNAGIAFIDHGNVEASAGDQVSEYKKKVGYTANLHTEVEFSVDAFLVREKRAPGQTPWWQKRFVFTLPKRALHKQGNEQRRLRFEPDLKLENLKIGGAA